MPFSLTTAPATVQCYIDDCLRPYMDNFVVCHLDDILIYSANEKEHEDQVHQVLQRLKELGLYCKAGKCQFGVSDVGLLGFVITPDGVGMQSDRISTIKDWQTLKSVRKVLVLPGFTNVYGSFIRKYGKVTLPLTELLIESESSCSKKSAGSSK